MGKRDIMLVMSDQHSWLSSGFADENIDTPELLRIAGEGLRFDHCYCNAPLCVPSRMSFLTGLLPSELEVFNNDTALPADMPTIAHALGGLGYRTVLIGRMHFKGDEQKHGFDEHLAGDITSQYWGTGGALRDGFGPYAGTTNRLHCLEQVGGGVSPVMLYDEAVFEETLAFLTAWEKEKKSDEPLFLVVGFYGPHFPFVCREDRYRKYQGRFSAEACAGEAAIPALSIYEAYQQESSPEHMRNCRAAYCGLAEQVDEYTGALYDRFRAIEGSHPGVFVYTSDHGEQLGKRKIYGKQTLYEDAVRVPLVIAGTGIKTAVAEEAVSLLDVSRTLLALADPDHETAYDWHRGRVLDLGLTERKPEQHPEQHSRWIQIQQLLTGRDRRLIFAEAAVDGLYKVLKAEHQYYVYNLEQDPEERNNLLEFDEVEAKTQIASAEAAGCFVGENEREGLLERERQRLLRQRRLAEWGRQKHPQEWAAAPIPRTMLREPTE